MGLIDLREMVTLLQEIRLAGWRLLSKGDKVGLRRALVAYETWSEEEKTMGNRVGLGVQNHKEDR